MTIEECTERMFKRCHLSWARDDVAVSEQKANIARDLEALVSTFLRDETERCAAYVRQASECDSYADRMEVRLYLAKQLLRTSPGKITGENRDDTTRTP